MHVPAPGPVVCAPASLPSSTLVRRLAELCSDARNVQVGVLLNLAEFDLRRGWAEAGYGSLWLCCLEVLHLREGAAWRRIEGMKALRRFRALEAPLREGKLCLTTANLLAPVLTDENLPELVARAAFLSKAEAELLVVVIRPRAAPRDGIRRIAEIAPAPAPAPLPSISGATPAAPVGSSPAGGGALGLEPGAAPPLSLGNAPEPAPPPSSRAELRPVSGEAYSLRVTLDAAAKAELDQLVSLLSHKTSGDLAAVLREAVRCGIAKHGKRKGAVEPERKRAYGAAAGPAKATTGKAEPSPARADPRAIPMDVKREVWRRDGGCCAWTSADGKRCGSRWKLEFGHIRPVALGGTSTVANVRIECRVHNSYEAVRFFGTEDMAASVRVPLPPAEVT